jgi:hypothetical protein
MATHTDVLEPSSKVLEEFTSHYLTEHAYDKGINLNPRFSKMYLLPACSQGVMKWFCAKCVHHIRMSPYESRPIWVWPTAADES